MANKQNKTAAFFIGTSCTFPASSKRAYFLFQKTSMAINACKAPFIPEIYVSSVTLQEKGQGKLVVR
jgi:hypothetical protein